MTKTLTPSHFSESESARYSIHLKNSITWGSQDQLFPSIPNDFLNMCPEPFVVALNVRTA